MVVAVCAVTVGDLFMSRAMKTLGPLEVPSLGAWWSGTAGLSVVLRELFELARAIFTQPYVWIAIGFMLTFMILWMIALSWSDLTFVMPLTALTYVLNAILVGPLLGESVSNTRWFGTLLIAGGVALLSSEPEVKKNQIGS